MILGIGLAGFLVLRHHDRVDLLGSRQDSYSNGKNGPGNGRGLGHLKGLRDRQGSGNDDEQGSQDPPLMPGMPGMPGSRGNGQFGPEGLGGLGGVGGTALHGSLTATVNGSVQALLFQRGEVTAVSATSITLKSSDGFAGTYGRNTTTVTRGAVPVNGGQAFVLARSSDKVALTIMATRVAAGAAPSS